MYIDPYMDRYVKLVLIYFLIEPSVLNTTILLTAASTSIEEESL
tara:strand:+ start:641 stop:772 length:132 start_codon:yes stop_codon:yes gene_type:complete